MTPLEPNEYYGALGEDPHAPHGDPEPLRCDGCLDYYDPDDIAEIQTCDNLALCPACAAGYTQGDDGLWHPVPTGALRAEIAAKLKLLSHQQSSWERECEINEQTITRLRAALGLIRAEVDAISLDDLDGTKSMALAEIDAAQDWTPAGLEAAKRLTGEVRP